MSGKILCICPSKYPEKMERMLDSFLVTRSKYTKIVVNYEEGCITDIFNKVFQNNPNEDFYFMANDDIIFETPLWDICLAKKGKITYGMDGIQNKNLPTFPMIDGNIVRALGWLQLPGLKKYCGDVVWKFIGESLKILEYREDVSIRHDWDESSWNEQINKEDMATFADWLQKSQRDLTKIRRVL